MKVKILPISFQWICPGCKESNISDVPFGTVFCEYCDYKATAQYDNKDGEFLEIYRLKNIIKEVLNRLSLSSNPYDRDTYDLLNKALMQGETTRSS
jgi:hypothetical protein